MPNKIRVLLADDVPLTRANICTLLSFDSDITVVGQAGTAEEAIQLAKQNQPDIILMDINMPGMDGIAAAQILTNELPDVSIIIMSVQNEQEYLRQAMIAGAKDYLTKPFTADELINAIKKIYTNEQTKRNRLNVGKPQEVLGKIITVFSTKGGIGKTTIATNLAVALADKADKNVCIVDVDLQFGDAALFLNLLPQATIADLVQDINNIDQTMLASYLCSFNSKVKVLAAPLRPEQAELVTGAHLTAILKLLQTMFEYIIVDTSPSFNDVNLAALDSSDEVLVITAMDLPTIKNIKLCLEIMESLNYSNEKIKMVLNRANSEGGMDVCEVEDTLHCSFSAALPSDGKTVVTSVNKGVPFVISNPDTIVAQSLFELAKQVASSQWEMKPKPHSIVNRLKSLFS